MSRSSAEGPGGQGTPEFAGCDVAASEAGRLFRRGGKTFLGKALLVAWILVTMLGLASLSLGHMVAMPQADDEIKLSRALLALRRDSSKDFLVHVIYSGCSCTERLFAHLVERGAFAGTEELVLFAGDDRAKRASAERAGFGFVNIPAVELAPRYGLEAAPVLVAFNAQSRLRYIGGYYNHPATVSPLDEEIHKQLASGATPASLPIFGCAVSARLQKTVDPLGVVYRGE